MQIKINLNCFKEKMKKKNLMMKLIIELDLVVLKDFKNMLV